MGPPGSLKRAPHNAARLGVVFVNWAAALRGLLKLKPPVSLGGTRLPDFEGVGFQTGLLKGLRA